MLQICVAQNIQVPYLNPLVIPWLALKLTLEIKCRSDICCLWIYPYGPEELISDGDIN